MSILNMVWLCRFIMKSLSSVKFRMSAAGLVLLFAAGMGPNGFPGSPVLLGASEHQLTVGQAVAMALEANPGLIMAESQAEVDYQIYRRRLLQAGARWSFLLDPAYGLFHGLAGPGGPAPGAEPAYVHSAGAGINVTRPLPTGGRAAAGVRHETGITLDSGSSGADGGDPDFSQSPSLFFNLSQPLFSEGRFIDTQAGRRAQESAKLDRQGSAAAYEQERNRTVIQVVELFLQVSVLREFQDITGEMIRLSEERLEASREDMASGLIAEADVLEQEILLGGQRELLLENSFRLLQAEQALARAIGFPEDLAKVDISADPNLGAGLMDALGPDKLAAMTREAEPDANPDVKSALLGLRGLELRQAMERDEFLPSFSAAFNLSPQYAPAQGGNGAPNGQATSRDFGESFSDLFGGDAFFQFSLSLGLEVPLFTAKERETVNSAHRAALAGSRARVEQAREIAGDLVESARLRHSMLAEKVSLLERNVALLERRLANQQALYEIGNVTAAVVDEAAVEARNKRNELLQVRADYAVATLELYNLLGGAVDELVLGYTGG